MKVQRTGLLQRVRTVLTALVVITGFGTSLMAMKPVEKAAAYTYGVSQTSTGMHYVVLKNVTGQPASSWECDASTKACTVNSDNLAPLGSSIPKAQATVRSTGIFVQ